MLVGIGGDLKVEELLGVLAPFLRQVEESEGAHWAWLALKGSHINVQLYT